MVMLIILCDNAVDNDDVYDDNDDFM